MVHISPSGVRYQDGRVWLGAASDDELGGFHARLREQLTYVGAGSER